MSIVDFSFKRLCPVPSAIFILEFSFRYSFGCHSEPLSDYVLFINLWPMDRWWLLNGTFFFSHQFAAWALYVYCFFFVSEFFIGSQIDWSTLRLPPGLVIMVVQFHFRPLRWSFALIIFCESILPHALFYYDELHLRFALQSFLTFHFNQSEFALIVSSFVDMCGLMIAMAVCCINLCRTDESRTRHDSTEFSHLRINGNGAGISMRFSLLYDFVMNNFPFLNAPT